MNIIPATAAEAEIIDQKIDEFNHAQVLFTQEPMHI